MPAVHGHHPKTGEEVERKPSLDEPFCALAFKIMTDPFVGKLTYFRVYSGVLEAGSYVYNPTTGQQGARRPHPPDARQQPRGARGVCAGDIAAAVGPQAHVTTGDTLCDEANPILLESIEFPEPVIRSPSSPRPRPTRTSSATRSRRLSEEDPTFRVRTDDETGQTIISGMGELHLEIIVDRLMREFKVEANVGKPQVAYRETITQAVEKVQGKLIRQTGGRGQYGHVVHRRSSRPGPAAASSSTNKIVGGVIPQGVHPGGREGHPGGASSRGVLAGYPIVDVKVDAHRRLATTRSTRPRWRSRSPARWRFKEAASKAEPVLLEPIMAVEVVTPDDFMGDVIGDINSRRGHIDGMEPRGNAPGHQRRTVPLSEMFGYATDLRSRTQGRATYTCSSRTTREVPKSIAEEIVAKVARQ